MEGLKHSATAFFNSYLMESTHHQLIAFGPYQAFSIPLNDEELIIPITRFSQLGRHEYTGRFFLKLGEVMESVPFNVAAGKLVPESLLSRVCESADNLGHILSQRGAELSKIHESTPDFITAEQALYAGHCLHPAPKSRTGFTEIDSKLYTPEARAVFPLRWFFVHETLIVEEHSENFTDKNWLRKIFQQEFPEIKIPAGVTPFPMHPWQASRILSRLDIRMYLAEGKIREVEEAGPDWMPTSSLRTLYRKSSNYMLKFSLDVKLTNSVRHMLEHELQRGLQVHDVFSKIEEDKNFKVLFEPVYLSILGIKETFVMGRKNVEYLEDYNLLAFMTQNHPQFQKNFIQKEISQLGGSFEEASVRWLNAFMEVVIRPFISLETKQGILLGAHQQNLLIRSVNHLPVAAVFRDCHGTGYTPKGFEKFQSFLDPENGNVLGYETGSYLFSYYLIINSLFNTIGAMASGNLVSEEKLINQATANFQEWKNTDLSESHCLQYLLSSEKLMHKGNFLCSMKNINENTTSNPLDIYVEITNPFSQRGHHHE